MGNPRQILHVDLDAFYASVEVRENPQLRGQPVIVGADPQGGHGRGVVSAASYEARRFGVHSAMPISRAYRQCPHGVYLPPRMTLYAEISGRFMDILARYTDQIEPLSIDEAFLDVTASARLFGDGEAIARRIRADIRDQERLVASVGVAPNKFVAKIASDLDKPDGLVVVTAEGLTDFLHDLPVSRIFGAGPRAQEKLATLGARTVGQVAALDLARLEQVFGPALAHHFHELSHGRDPRPVEVDRERRSVGREHTFHQDVQCRETVRQTLLALLEDVTATLRRDRIVGRTLTLKYRNADFETRTRSRTLDEATDTTEELWPVTQELLRRADRGEAIRLVGVSLSQLGARQRSLFEAPSGRGEDPIGRTMDRIAARFGHGSVKRARLLGGPDPRPPLPPR